MFAGDLLVAGFVGLVVGLDLCLGRLVEFRLVGFVRALLGNRSTDNVGGLRRCRCSRRGGCSRLGFGGLGLRGLGALRRTLRRISTGISTGTRTIASTRLLFLFLCFGVGAFGAERLGAKAWDGGRAVGFVEGCGVVKRALPDGRRQGAFEDLQAHGVGEVLARVENGGAVACVAQCGGHGVPPESVEVYAGAGAGDLFDAGDHVRVAGNEDEVGEFFAQAVDHEVGDEAGVNAFLGASFAPFDELAGAELHAVAGAQCALVAVGPGVGDAVVPELPMDGLVELVGDHVPEGVDYLGEIDF